MSKTRLHSLITYATEKQIKKVIALKSQQLRGAMWIHHDKDDAEPHYHVAFCTYESRTEESVKNWFKHFKDSKGEYVNTMNETIGDIQALTEYFTHEDEQSREEGKHLYPRECLHRLGEFREDKKTHRSIDHTYDIMCDIEKGVHYRVLVRKYGRDFLLHYKTYLDFVHDCEVQDFYAFGHRYKEMRETDGDLDITHINAVELSTERPLQKEDLL